MKDFEYLDAEIDPPLWVNVTTAIVVLLAYFGFLAVVASSGAPQFLRRGSSGYNSFGRNRR